MKIQRIRCEKKFKQGSLFRAMGREVSGLEYVGVEGSMSMFLRNDAVTPAEGQRFQ